MGLVTVQSNSGVPKYKQIINSIEKAIADGSIKKGYRLPSINSIRFRYSLSRDTVFIAYNNLKERDIIFSIPGKGYYLKKETIDNTEKVS